ncbi:MAG: hypothetical protein ACFFE8_09670 [Candidatus Heimdallarchaeota archaeon]
MPIIKTTLAENYSIIFPLRLITGLIWFGTAIRRILIPNFFDRIADMAAGEPLLPPALMDWAVSNWVLIFAVVLSLEIISSLSLLTGTFARAGAALATFNGFAIGLAGIGLGILDLIIPWTAALMSLVLLLFSHPGMYRGIDEQLSARDLPEWVKVLM